MNGQKSDFGKYLTLLVVSVIIFILLTFAVPAFVGGAADAADAAGQKVCTELTFCETK